MILRCMEREKEGESDMDPCMSRHRKYFLYTVHGMPTTRTET